MALESIIHRTNPTWLERFNTAPFPTVAKSLYAQRQRLYTRLRFNATKRKKGNISLVCISDTHNAQPQLPIGDILIHAGDLTQNGTSQELQAQLDWLNAQPHKHKIVIAGNHDVFLDEHYYSKKNMPAASTGPPPPPLLLHARQRLRWGSIIYLQDSATEIELANGADHKRSALLVYGTPHTRKNGNWAFQYERGCDMFTGRIADGTEVLITHSPPSFHLDVAGWGDIFLLHELWRTKPSVHVFGHIHAGHGLDILIYDRFEELYESLCSGKAGFFALFHMALLLLVALIIGPDSSKAKTTLINASIVGGARDEMIQTARIVSI